SGVLGAQLGSIFKSRTPAGQKLKDLVQGDNRIIVRDDPRSDKMFMLRQPPAVDDRRTDLGTATFTQSQVTPARSPSPAITSTRGEGMAPQMPLSSSNGREMQPTEPTAPSQLVSDPQLPAPLVRQPVCAVPAHQQATQARL